MHYFRREWDEEKSLKKSGRKKISGVNVVGYLFCGLIALVCLIPFIMVLAASFTSEEAISLYGFSLWPKEFSLEAYKGSFQVAGGSGESLSCHDHADFSRYSDRFVTADYDRICPFQTRF